MEIPKDKKIYFSSDNHLGLPSLQESHDREKIFVKWLDSIKHDAEIVFLLGDLFDFWFEYKEAVPRGFTRSLGKLAELSDMGIKIYFFVGNHDYWMTDYFQEELNIKVFKSPELFIFNSKSFSKRGFFLLFCSFSGLGANSRKDEVEDGGENWSFNG